LDGKPSDERERRLSIDLFVPNFAEFVGATGGWWDMSDSNGRLPWAYETFGSVEAGSRRRTARVVTVAAGVAARPGGTVTQVFSSSADREGAYRVLSNDAVKASELTRAMCDATADACRKEAKVYVPVDGTSLSFTDTKNVRGVGDVGGYKGPRRGLQVLTALAVSEQGTPVGVLEQSWWARSERSPVKRHFRRKLESKETRFWLATLKSARTRIAQAAPKTRAVFLLDRGFDSWAVLQMTRTDDVSLVVRAAYNRKIVAARRNSPQYLVETLRAQPVLGRYDIEVPASGGHPARTARMHLQATRVTLELRPTSKRRTHLEINAVLAREVRGPQGRALSWMLLTTEPINTFSAVIEVVRAYGLRWRIEEVHRAWKRGGCNVEDSQLRSREGIIKWATIHCAVATRAVRLAQLARERPTVPASEEFVQAEIDAAIVLKKRTKLRPGDHLSLAEAVTLIAELGGYTGKSSGGPPGPTVIARGLERVAIAAEVLENLQRK